MFTGGDPAITGSLKRMYENEDPETVSRGMVDAEVFAYLRQGAGGGGQRVASRGIHVFVAGATGAIGRRLVPALLAAGHQVTGATRSSARAGALADAGATPVIVDALDGPALSRAVAEARPDAVVNQLTDLPQAPSPRGIRPPTRPTTAPAARVGATC